ncbi:MAG: CvpA family protein [Candidatus Dormibacteria bacterium]
MLFDVLIGLYIVGNIAAGFRWGFFRRLLSFAGFYLGLLLARGLSVSLTQSAGWNTGGHPVAGQFAMFLLVVVGMTVVAEIMGFAYRRVISFLNTLFLDRTLGAVAGALAAVLQLSILLYLFGYMLTTAGPNQLGQPAIVTDSQESLSSSYLAHGLKKVQDLAVFLYRPVLPEEPTTFFARASH